MEPGLYARLHDLQEGALLPRPRQLRPARQDCKGLDIIYDTSYDTMMYRCSVLKSSTSTWTSTRLSSTPDSLISLEDTAGKGVTYHSKLVLTTHPLRWERFVHSENQHLVSPEALDFLDKLLRRVSYGLEPASTLIRSYLCFQRMRHNKFDPQVRSPRETDCPGGDGARLLLPSD